MHMYLLTARVLIKDMQFNLHLYIRTKQLHYMECHDNCIPHYALTKLEVPFLKETSYYSMKRDYRTKSRL